MEFLKGLEDIKFQLRFKLQKFYLTTFLTMMHCCCRCSQNSKLPQLSSRHFFMKNDEISTVKKKIKCQEMLLLLRVLLLLCWWMKKNSTSHSLLTKLSDSSFFNSFFKVSLYVNSYLVRYKNMNNCQQITTTFWLEIGTFLSITLYLLLFHFFPRETYIILIIIS